MKKLLLVLVLIAGVAVVYSVLSDPEKKEAVLGTIEGSTGVDLDASPQDMLDDAGKAVGGAADRVLKDLGDALTDPELYRSLEKWGRDALDKLDEADIERLKRDFELEGGGLGADYDAIFEKYLGEAVSS